MLFTAPAPGRHRKPRTSNTARLVATAGLGTAGIALPLIGATAASAAPVSTWDKVASCESGGDWTINTGNGYYGGLQFSASTWSAYGGGTYASTADHASKSQQIAIAEKVLASQGPGAWPVCGPQAGLTQGGAAASVPAASSSTATSAPTSTPTQQAAPTQSSTPASTPTKAAPTKAAPTQSAAQKSTGKHSAAEHSSAVPAASQTARTVSTPKHAAPAATTTSAAGHSTGHGDYTVKPGDTLSGIAAAAHLDGGWPALYQENRSTVGGNPDLIFPGQHFQIG